MGSVSRQVEQPIVFPPVATLTPHGLIEAILKFPSENLIGDLYIFGSALRTSHPNDLDLLLIIDKFVVPTTEAYLRTRSMVQFIEITTGLLVDLTILTKEEAIESHFVAEVAAIQITFISTKPSTAI